MQLTESNYYSIEANKEYCSASQYKDFIGYPLRHGCEERALATINGEYKEETTKALLMGSILDALWENDDPEYILERFPDCVSSRGATKGQLKSEYQQVIDMYDRSCKEKMFCIAMSGEKQKIMTGEIEGLPFKIKIDSFIDGELITDLKTTQTLDRTFRYYIPDSGEKLPFYYAYGYDIQLAIYREIVRQNTGDRLKSVLACVDKKSHPICDVIEITPIKLDEALESVKQNCEKIIMLKSGEVEPVPCGHSDCDWCRDHHACKIISTEDFEMNEPGEGA